MIVHGLRESPFARKVRVVLEEKGITYSDRHLSPVPATPELLAMHPMGKIPILELDDGTYVPDSSVICLFLERVHPDPALYPADPKEYARALFLEEFADTKVFAVAGEVLFERYAKPKFLREEPDTALVGTLLEEQLPPALDWLEQQVPADRGTIFARISIADAALGAHLGSLRLAGETIDRGRWPRLACYVEKLWDRPSFVRSAPAST